MPWQTPKREIGGGRVRGTQGSGGGGVRGTQGSGGGGVRVHEVVVGAG